MKKNFLFILLFVMIFSVNVNADTLNLLQNAGFEKVSESKASNWTTYVWEDKKGEYTITSDDSVKHSGDRSMKLTTSFPTDIRLKQEITVKPNTLYKITAWVKTENVGLTNKGANISADGILYTSNDIKGTNNWQQIEFYGQAGKSQKKATITIGLGGYGSLNTGTIWIDDVSVEAIKALPTGIKSVSLQSESDTANNTSQKTNSVSAVIFVLATLLSISFAFVFGKSLMQKPYAFPISRETNSLSEKLILNKKDWQVMGVITIVYLIISVINLGSLNIPKTSYSPKNTSELVTIDFGKKVDLGRIYYYCGLGDGSFKIEALDDKGTYTQIATVEKKDIFSLKYTAVSYRTNKIRFVPTSANFTLNELYFVENGQTSPIQGFSIETVNNDANKLFDEQKTFTYKPSYLTNTYFDEIYHARTAFEHIHSLEVYEWTHPPLGKLFIAIGVLIFGMNPFGFRIVGTLFGVAMLPLMYLFGKKLFKDWRFAAITSLLMMFDFMHFTQTRIATIDVYGTFFIIAMYYYMYDVFMVKSYDLPLRLSIKPLFLCGLMFGIGVASKWIVAYGGAGLALAFFISKYIEFKDFQTFSKSQSSKKPEWLNGFIKKNIVITMLLCVIFFVIIPAAIYYASYIPYMKVPGAKSGIELVLDYQKQMFDYHSKLKATHSFSSPWYEWPIIYKPTWFYSGSDVAVNNASTIVTMGNPAIWWTGILAFFMSVYIAIKKKDKKMVLIFIAIFFQYIPWALVPRITWIYHYFSTVPFIIICIVYVIKELYDRKAISRKTIIGYLVICALLFIWFYPALSGLEVPKSYINLLHWFKSWIF